MRTFFGIFSYIFEKLKHNTQVKWNSRKERKNIIREVERMKLLFDMEIMAFGNGKRKKTQNFNRNPKKKLKRDRIFFSIFVCWSSEFQFSTFFFYIKFICGIYEYDKMMIKRKHHIKYEKKHLDSREISKIWKWNCVFTS